MVVMDLLGDIFEVGSERRLRGLLKGGSGSPPRFQSTAKLQVKSVAQNRFRYTPIKNK